MRRSKGRWAGVVAVAALAAAGCADDPTDDAAAVEAMVLETCAPPAEGTFDEAEPVCRCAYEALLDEYGSEELSRLDSLLRHDPEALPEEARRLVLDCAFELVAPDVPPVPTTEPEETTTSAGEDDDTTTTSAGDDDDTTTTTTERDAAP